jgi:hypothetical protein
MVIISEDEKELIPARKLRNIQEKIEYLLD